LFTFNEVDSSGYLIENDVHHAILPPLSSRLLTVPDRVGAYDFGVEIGTREIAVDVTINGASLEDLRAKVREIAAWLFHKDVKPLVFSDEPDKTYYARVAGSTDLDQIVTHGQGTITFLCPDPHAEGMNRSQTIVSGDTITNSGTIEVYPVVTVMFPAAATNLKLIKGFEQVYIKSSFAAGDVLVLDHKKALVTLNGSPSMPTIDLSTVFFPLDVGGTVLTFEPNASVSVQVDFKEKWL